MRRDDDQRFMRAAGAATNVRMFTSMPTSQSSSKPGSIRNDGIRQYN